MQKVIILRGLPFSGKTTWAHKFNRKQGESFVIFDTRAEIREIHHRYPTLDIIQQRDAADLKLIQLLNSGYNVIVDDNNILSAHMKRIFSCIKETKYKTGYPVAVRIKDFTTPVWLCVNRCNESDDLMNNRKELDLCFRYCQRNNIIYSNEENS